MNQEKPRISFDLYWFDPQDMGNDDPFLGPLGGPETKITKQEETQ